MADKEHWTPQQIMDALKQAEGFQSTAANILGCSIPTIQNYMKRYPEIRQVYEDLRYQTDDFVESKILKAIKADNVTMIIFYAKTRMRHRGYAERDGINYETLPKQTDEDREADFAAIDAALQRTEETKNQCGTDID